MKGADFRRVIRNVNELYGIDENLLGAVVSLKAWIDDIDLINAVYSAGARLHQMFGLFGNWQNTLRAFHSGVNPTDWTPATEAFIRAVEEQLVDIQTARKAVSDEAARQPQPISQ